jgi:hypothetical protein
MPPGMPIHMVPQIIPGQMPLYMQQPPIPIAIPRQMPPGGAPPVLGMMPVPIQMQMPRPMPVPVPVPGAMHAALPLPVPLPLPGHNIPLMNPTHQHQHQPSPIVAISSGPQAGPIVRPGIAQFETKAPISIPAGWTPTLAVSKPVLAAAASPYTVFIGKIPVKLDNELLLNCLKECGKVLKWNRPMDCFHNYKSFGFCIFENGFGALRCNRVLGGINFNDCLLSIKLGSKELTNLEVIAQVILYFSLLFSYFFFNYYNCYIEK